MAYSGLPRYYYFASTYIIKEYIFTRGHSKENSRQIVAEINSLLHLKNIHNMPKLVTFELTPERAKLVVERIQGGLLVDLIEADERVDPVLVAHDVLRSLADLEAQGLHHNDVRSWNIIYDGKKASLIDYGVVSHKATDYDLVSLLWTLAAALSGQRETYAMRKTKLPKPELFKKYPALTRLYQQISDGETSPKALLRVFTAQPKKK